MEITANDTQTVTKNSILCYYVQNIIIKIRKIGNKNEIVIINAIEKI